MRIVVIHDRRAVADEIRQIADKTIGRGCHVDSADDVISARDLLRANFYDLAVIDLTLPLKHGKGQATLDATNVLLGEIFETGDVKVPSDILGISLSPDVLTLVQTSVGQHLMACIHEDPADRWMNDLAAKLLYVQATRSARQLVANSSHDLDLLVITAHDKEAKPYAGLFELTDSEEFRGARRFDFVSLDGVIRRGAVFSVGESGQAPSGSATQALLCQFRPRLAVMSGFCGGVSPRVDKGDAIAFRSSAAWDYGKWEDVKGSSPVFRPRPGALNIPTRGVRDVVRSMLDDYTPDAATLGAVVQVSGGKLTGWRFDHAVGGSGSAVVTSSEKLNEITANDDAIWAVDMESFAFYHACLNTPVRPPDFVCIKAVADHCNGEKDNSLHEACCLISASIVKEIVTKRYSFTNSAA